MAIERTLSIVKPDGVKAGLTGEILKRFESAGLIIAAMRMTRLTKREAQVFYDVHQERPFFESLTNFMCSGPIVVSVLEGEDAIRRNRKLMGATNPAEADSGTIRREYASNVEQNIVHGSDAPETASREIGYFFNESDLVRGDRR